MEELLRLLRLASSQHLTLDALEAELRQVVQVSSLVFDTRVFHGSRLISTLGFFFLCSRFRSQKSKSQYS